jgi:hypothetical protein
VRVQYYGATGAVVISYVQNAERWQKRAQEMRSIAEQLIVFERAKAAILRIAEEHERWRLSFFLREN